MLSLRNLRKRFGDIVAVDTLSLEIPRGVVFGFLGPNGAGKTTTLSMAVGLLAPDSGEVTLEGLGPPTDPTVRKTIGLAPQASALYDDLTADENLAFFGRLYGLSGAALKARTSAVLDLVGLSDRREDRVKGYSGGMKRRLNLAAALMHEPTLLLLDEPTAGVDPQSRNAILDVVRTLRDRGCTVVYTTHYMEEAQRLCDLVAVIDHGKLLALGTVDELIATHGGESVVTIHRTTGEEKVRSATPVAVLSEHLARKDVLNIRVDRPDLEGVFLALTGRSLRD
ncbi:MAG TPA: ABC transporter ATP-binding protein [Phycisphaerales bacterium]|nr:ABC transporter ATP-binding protein [Phycisphaerales bacterium]